jgi:hypothetical protein
MIFSSLRFAFRWNDHNAGQFNVYCGTGSITQVTSAVTLKAATYGHFKTGHFEWAKT